MSSTTKVIWALFSVIFLGTTIGLVNEFNTTVIDDSAQFKNWVTIEEAVAQAEKDGKYILIDFYTDWCSYCKKMDKEVYTNKIVQDVLDKNFLSVKINAESKDMITFKEHNLSQSDFAYALKVSSYPTTAFLTPKAEIITTLPGYLPADKFSPILEYIGSGDWEKMSFEDYLTKLGK